MTYFDTFFAEEKDQDYSFTVNNYGLFTNNVINHNAIRLARIFGNKLTCFDKKKEFIATSDDLILVDAQICCIAIAFDLESLRNTLVAQQNNYKTGSVYEDISALAFPLDKIKREKLCKLIMEIYIVRDAIAHAHKHNVKVTVKNYKIESASVHISDDALRSQGDRKYKNNVSHHQQKTLEAKLNVALPKISFLDVLKMLIIFDIVSKHFAPSHMTIHFAPEDFNTGDKAKWGPLSFDLTHVILYFINELEPASHVFKQLQKFVIDLEKSFPNIPHGHFKRYRLYDYRLWDNYDFLKYPENDSSKDM